MSAYTTSAVHDQILNVTNFSLPEFSVSPSPDGLLASAASLWNFLISFPAVRDGAKLFLIGGSLESARRLLFMAWAYLIESFFITVEFEDRDDSFIWIMFWLSKQETWNKSRNIRISTSRYGQSGPADKVPGEEEDGKVPSPLRRLAYMPAHNKTQYLWYKGSLMTVTRSQTQGDMWNRIGDERVSITLFTRKFSKIDMLLLEAKRAYKKESEGRINIYVSDTQNEWTLTGSRPKRPLSSVVLERGIKEHLLIDAKDFMASEKWYADRGIPWRRGYLLHGSPGSGKTSLIHSLAGELDLDIYVISLSKKNLDDSSLNELISKLPSRSLALMEDIDVAFFRGVTREGDFGVPLMPGQPPGTPALDLQSGSPAAQGSSASGVTLSGLLGAIDGVAAQEGRLLFATTNKYAALDPALVRPGRLDVHVRFDNAGRVQAAKLFRCFFPPEADMEGGKHGAYNNDEDIEDEEWIGDSTHAKSPPGLPSGSVLPAAVKGSNNSTSVTDTNGTSSDLSAIYTTDPGTRCPSLTRGEVGRLARAFAERVPEGEFSMAAIQGLLMQYKTRPYLVIKEVEAWVAAERRKRAERDGKSIIDGEKREESDNTDGETPPEVILKEESIGIEESVPCIWWPMGMI